MPQRWEDKSWFEPYQLALLEINPTELPSRIEVAKAAIYARIGELDYSESANRELIALNDAMTVLHSMSEHEQVRKRLP